MYCLLHHVDFTPPITSMDLFMSLLDDKAHKIIITISGNSIWVRVMKLQLKLTTQHNQTTFILVFDSCLWGRVVVCVCVCVSNVLLWNFISVILALSKWSQVYFDRKEPAPIARWDHGSAVVGDALYIFGGMDQNNKPLGDFWKFETSNERLPSSCNWFLYFLTHFFLVVISPSLSYSEVDRNEIGSITASRRV